ncbi:hypothetical protein Tco_0449841 [Tanacetum coccineum]
MVVWCSVVMECEGGDVAVDGVASWGEGGEAVAVRVVVRRCDSGDGGVVDSHGGCRGVAVVVFPKEVEARGGEWIWGSGRSGHEDNIWFRPERSPENFSGGGGMVAGGGGRREGWPDNWGRWRRERGL